MPTSATGASSSSSSSSSSSPSICSKMLSGSSDVGQRVPIRLRQDNKFCRRLLSRESSATGTGTPSFRVYYGVASGAVPFVWESEPGTPKHDCSGPDGAPSPLTPPPSHQCSPGRAASHRKPSRGANLVRAIVPRLARRKGGGVTPLASLPSFPSTSPTSSFSTTGSSHCRRRRRSPSTRTSALTSVGDEESASSTLCFGIRHGRFRGCCNMVIVKKAFLSIVGHGSSRVV